MRESSTYQAILEEGRLEGRLEGQLQEARALLLKVGRRYLGKPSKSVSEAVSAIVDLTRLESLTIQAPDAKTWRDLLGAA